MFLSLTSPSASEKTSACADPSIVGGKAASLAKLAKISTVATGGSDGDAPSLVPKSFALTVSFFQPWVEALQRDCGSTKDDKWETLLTNLQQRCQTLPFSKEQSAAIIALLAAYCNEDAASSSSSNIHNLVAVRSSAPQEDGFEQSFAGAFATKLGVPLEKVALEQAVRDCFISRLDSRVMAYVQSQSNSCKDDSNNDTFWKDLSFAVVVMNMVDSEVSGVAFSSNPLTNDRDELVIDSSYGLGESVVDGAVSADRYVYDKVQGVILSKQIGTKMHELRLKTGANDHGTESIDINSAEQQKASSLTDAQLDQLAQVMGEVEKEYGMPMDVEWAFSKSTSDDALQMHLLQARPITTLFTIDDNMMTEPGEKRILYYDYNVVSDATTTDPFTYMDIQFYGFASSLMMGLDHNMFSTDPNMPIFMASTRQYCNMSIFLQYMSTEYCAKAAAVLDPYLASIFDSKDCDRDKYRMKKLPSGVGLWGLCKLMWQFPMRKLYKISKACQKNPEQAKLKYQEIAQQDMAKFKELDARGPKPGQGLQAFTHELFLAMNESFTQQLGIVLFAVLPLFKELEKQRREGETEEIRSQYDALCGGYEGDALMQMNIDMYNLANLLPEKVWEEYPHKDLDKLALRIQSNLEGEKRLDLPTEFLEEWRSFMDRHGWDGQNQLFVSCPRYKDNPVPLLAKLRQNVGAGIRDPSDIQREQVEKRRAAMAAQEEEARAKGWWSPFALSKVQQRNGMLEHLMWIRNAPKMHLSHMCGILRAAVLQIEANWIGEARLEQKGDIYHLSFEEIDEASEDDTFDIMVLIRPRKLVFDRAVRSNLCPLLVDSRCRILKPDPPKDGEHEPGTLVGAAVSPGVATGRVRVIHSPSDEFEKGEVLVAVVTGPAWTPLFIGASAIILQIGGVLQHGALCAREFGKPAVSNIDITSLKTGMEVSVDGNTGVVKILSQDGSK